MNYTAARFEVCEERFQIFYAKLRESKWLVKLQNSLVKMLTSSCNRAVTKILGSDSATKFIQFFN